jgi:hypothetical protein
MIYFIPWFALAIIVGVAANTRGRNWLGWFILAFVISPLIAGLLLLAMPQVDTSGPVRLANEVGEPTPTYGFSFERALVIFLALIVACIVAGIALAIGVIAPDWTLIDSDPFERVAFFVTSFFATGIIGATALVPALLLIAVAEIMRLRSSLYYAAAGAVVGLASYFGSNVDLRLENTTNVTPIFHPLQLAAAAGIVGGLAYWLIAGRRAGRWREG